MIEFPYKGRGSITYVNPQEIEETAKTYAEKRIKRNSALHEIAPEYDRGGLANSVDELGIAAELIALDFLKQNNILFDALDVFEERPIKSADVFINDYKIDIKGVRIDNQNLTVNRKAHFQKDVTHYWFIKPLKNENGKLTGLAEYWIIPAMYVSLWKVNDGSFTPYFYKSIIEVNNILDEK
jgi:hypothetical protein